MMVASPATAPLSGVVTVRQATRHSICCDSADTTRRVYVLKVVSRIRERSELCANLSESGP
jgi:hypothetical protein